MIILVIAIFIFGAASVSASDMDDTAISSEDTGQMGLSASSELTADNLKTGAENNTLTQANDFEVLGADEIGTFTELQNEIDNVGNGTLNLTRDYQWDSDFTGYGIVINKPITINGNGHYIDALGEIRIFELKAKNDVILDNITFKNGNTDGCGGAINVWYDLSNSSFTNLNFINNTAADNGGAVRFRYSSTNNTFENIIFLNNTDKKDGGALYIGDKSLSNSFTNMAFTNNFANGNGGALYIKETSTSDTFENLTFENNTVPTKDAGAINFHRMVDGAAFNNVLFIKNRAEKRVGGAINIDAGIINSVFNNTYFIDNVAKTAGALGITGNISSLTFENILFINNTALTDDGGAINIGPWAHSDLANTTFKNVLFANNTAAQNGGALHVTKNTLSNTFEDVIFINNTAKGRDGGAIRFGALNYQYTTQDNTFDKVLFANNTANRNGGALYVTGVSTSNTFGYMVFANNIAKNTDGGAVNFYKAVKNTTFNEIIFYKNSAPKSRSGAVNFDKGMQNSIFNNTQFVENSANITGVITLSGVTSSNTFENIQFLNNTAQNYLIYVNNATSDNIIQDSIFLNNNASQIKVKNGNIQLTDNWFGNNATNYDNDPDVNDNLDNWLFLNATASPAAINLNQTSTVKFKFYSYDSNTKAIKDYNKSLFIFLDLYSTLGLVNTPVELINEDIIYTPSEVGNGTVTARYITAYYTITIENSKIPTVIKPAVDGYAVYVDDTRDNLAVLQNEYGNNITDEYTLTYTSNNESVVKIVNDSFVAVGVGNAVITVSFNGSDKYEAAENVTFNVGVVKIPTNINLAADAIELTINDEFSAGATLTPADAGELIYTSTDEKIVKVVDGMIVAVGAGNAAVSVSFAGNGKYDAAENKTIDVTVNKYMSQFVNLELNGDLEFTAVLVNSIGDVIPDANITYTTGSKNGTLTTGADGSFTLIAENNAVLSIVYAGNSEVNATRIEIDIEKIAPKRLGSEFNVTEGVSIKTYAVDTPAGEIGQTTSFKLTDSNGNPIVNATVKFAYKTVILNRTTDENGIVFIGINTQVAQEALCAMSYLGDENYNATFVAFSFDIQHKPITISASDKTFKVSAKNKKYTVTIKTEKCNSRDGKVYLSAGKKLTMKINGKTYTAKTNAKGQATFNIKITKKGKFAASVKFAGDKTYASASKSVKITIK